MLPCAPQGTSPSDRICFQMYTLSETPDVFIPFFKLLAGSKDYVMIGVQVLYLIATILHIPLILYPCREQIYIFY